MVGTRMRNRPGIESLSRLLKITTTIRSKVPSFNDESPRAERTEGFG